VTFEIIKRADRQTDGQVDLYRHADGSNYSSFTLVRFRMNDSPYSK